MHFSGVRWQHGEGSCYPMHASIWASLQIRQVVSLRRVRSRVLLSCFIAFCLILVRKAGIVGVKEPPFSLYVTRRGQAYCEDMQSSCSHFRPSM